MPKITPCLWFDNQAEEAARFYVSVFKNSRVTETSHYGKDMPMPEGTVLTIAFELDGTPFTALNGGPVFQFSEAISLQVPCADQAEVDYFWEKLLEGGQESQCGWLKDRFGLSWQVFPTEMIELMADPDKAKAGRVGAAMMQMIKIDLAKLREAAAG